MNFFNQHQLKYQHQQHFIFLIDLCTSGLSSEKEFDLFNEEFRIMGNFKNTFCQIIDSRVVFLILEFQKHHNASDNDVFSFTPTKFDGPNYSHKRDVINFILEAYYLILVMDKTVDTTNQSNNLIRYSVNHGIGEDEVMRLTLCFEELLVDSLSGIYDIKEVDFYQISERVILQYS